MHQGKSLVELATEIERRANSKKDVIVNTRDLRLDYLGHLHVSDKYDVEVNDIAHGQISSRLNIPKAYYDRMRSQQPTLLAANVNTWFRDQSEDRMVRMLDGKARALLSDRYRPMENEDLAQAVLPVLLSKGLDIMSAEITERRLYIKAVDKKVTRELAKHGAHFGDGGHTIVRCASPAITITNSEVGQGRMSILTSIFDSFCSNLATFGERSLKKQHVGARHEMVDGDVTELFSDETRKVTDEALWRQVRDVVSNAFNPERFHELVDKVEGTQKDKIEDAVRVVELSSKRWDWSEVTGKSVLKHLIEGADLSRFGLYNAVTRASSDVEDYDEATAMERQGGEIIELPRNEWMELAKAA